MLHSRGLKKLRVYSDGASRGNPGPAAIAFKIADDRGVVLKMVSKFLGRRTNNQAEYEALIAALRSAHGFTDGDVHCFLDSELVVRQLNGEYQVRNPQLNELWLRVHELRRHFSHVLFTHVARTDGNLAEVDELANEVLDKVIS